MAKSTAILLTVLALGLAQGIRGDVLLAEVAHQPVGVTAGAASAGDECYSGGSWLVCQFANGGRRRAAALAACESRGYALATPGSSESALSTIATLMANFPCTSSDFLSQFWTGHRAWQVIDQWPALWAPGEPNSGYRSVGVTMRVDCEHPSRYNDSFNFDENGGYICYTGH